MRVSPGGSADAADGERAAAGYLYVLLAAGLWAVITPVSRLLLERGVSAAEIALWRSVIAWLLFAAHVLVVGRRRGWWASALPRVRDVPGLALFALIGIAGLYAALPLAVEFGGAALASILLYTAPAWVALLAWPLLGERLTVRKAAALALTLAGIVAFGSGAGDAGGRAAPGALLWGLGAGLCYASLYLFGKHYFARYPPPLVFLWTLPLAAAVLVAVAAPRAVGLLEGAALVLLGTASTYGAYLAYGAALARLEATRASVAATAEPVMAAALAFAFFGERFGALGYGGGVLILCGVIVMALAPRAPPPH
jgi:drug/metabolite transporter, DME family